MVAIPKKYVSKVFGELGVQVVLSRVITVFRRESKKSPELNQHLSEALRLQHVFNDKKKLNFIQEKKLKDLLESGMHIDETLGD